MMSMLNKERVVCLVAAAGLALALVLAARTAGSLTLSRDYEQHDPEVRSVIKSDVEIEPVKLTESESPRDPFVMLSSWRRAPQDPLPAPELERLRRRVPLPMTLAHAPRAMVPRETQMPVQPEEEGDE